MKTIHTKTTVSVRPTSAACSRWLDGLVPGARLIAPWYFAIAVLGQTANPIAALSTWAMGMFLLSTSPNNSGQITPK